MSLDVKLLEVLRCPACPERPEVRLEDDGRALVCVRCGRRYPVEDGIPRMVVEAPDEEA